MEVSGQITAPSRQISKLYCVPCERDGLKEMADGYCQDCHEHLCKTCLQHHRRSTPSRDHVLLNKDVMPLQRTAVHLKSDVIQNSCTNHRGKSLEFFCKSHKSLACCVCVTLDHKECKVVYIPDVSGNVSEELKDFITTLEVLLKKCESNIYMAKKTTTQLDQSYAIFVEEIRCFRMEINAHLDRMESEMLKEARSIVNTAREKLENVNRVCEEIAQEVKSSQSLLNALNKENKKNKLFIEMKKITPRITSLSNKERQTVKDNKTYDSIGFIRNQKMLYYLKLEKSFGMISTYNIPLPDRSVHVQYEKSIDIQMSPDMEQCDVSGMLMISSTYVIVTDHRNKKIKLIDVVNGTLVSEEKLSSGPLDIVQLPNNKLAVSFLDEKYIQIMSYTNTSMSLDRRIDIGEECDCIAYCQSKLVVGCGCNQGKLVIMDLDGNIIQVFDTTGLFDGPKKIIISNDEKFLYVSMYHTSISNDDMSSMCIKMDWEGNIVQRFQQPGYKSPVGLQELEDCTLLVCYKDNHNIVRLSSSLKRCEIVGLEDSSLNYPWALAYSERDHKLYVSCASKKGHLEDNDTIKVFNVKWIK